MNFVILQTSASEPSGWQQYSTIIFFFLFFVILYFFMIRPQSRKAKEQKNFINEIKIGDKIVTTSGIHGKISKVEDDCYLVDVDSNTKLRMEKSAVSLELTRAMMARKQN